MFFDIIEPPNVSNKKIAILFPYRERIDQNRSQQLKSTLDYYNKLNISNIDMYVIEQGNNKPFNRGVLLNAGHNIIKKSNIGYVNEVHHDIDVQPDKTLIKYFYSDDVIACRKAHWYEYFFGTLSVLPLDVMDKVNGYSNNFWGWGREDTNLSRRIRDKNIKIYNADPKITSIKSLPHKDAHTLGIKNMDMEKVDNEDIKSGYKSGLSDLQYSIVNKKVLNDHTFKYIIDF